MPLLFPTGTDSLLLLEYAALAALFVAAALAFLLIPALLRGDAKPESVGKAFYCCVMEGFGIALMTVSGLPALSAVLTGTQYPSSIYLALLVVFGVGGALFLWHENMQYRIDVHSRHIPSIMYHYALKTYGLVTTILATFTLLAYLFFSMPPLPTNWWAHPTIFLVYGLFVTWTARNHPGPALFQIRVDEKPPRPKPAKKGKAAKRR